MSLDDAQQDALIVLMEMRSRWEDAAAAHLSIERQERMIVAWARLRLIDKYEPEFNRQKVTHSIEGGISGRADRGRRLEPQFTEFLGVYPGERRMRGTDGGMSPTQQVEDYREPKLSDLDRSEIRELITRLPDRQQQIVKLYLFEGMTQSEVAKQLGISQPAVSAGFERACMTLRASLKPFVETGK